MLAIRATPMLDGLHLRTRPLVLVSHRPHHGH